MSGQPQPILPGDGTLFDTIYGGGERLSLAHVVPSMPFPRASLILLIMWGIPAIIYFLFDRFLRRPMRVRKTGSETDDEAAEDKGARIQGRCLSVMPSMPSSLAAKAPAAAADGTWSPEGSDVEAGPAADKAEAPSPVPNPSGGRSAKTTASESERHSQLERELLVLYSALEFKVPGVQKCKAIAGGLGKVTDLISRHHPTDIIMVHPMVAATEKISYAGISSRDEPLCLTLDGKEETVQVFRHVAYPQGDGGPSAVFLLLSHPLFEERTTEFIYPNPMTRRNVLLFWCLWNKAVGALIVRHKPHIFHCPDFHSAVAPWYARPGHPDFRVLLVLHNAEYQGQISTNMILGQRLKTMAKLWDLPGEPEGMLRMHLTYKGRFNMLKSVVDFIAEHQHGVGCCAVSQNYATECHEGYSILWSLPVVTALDNPMLEEERPPLLEGKDLAQTKACSKEEVQKRFNLDVNPDAKVLVFLGRLVRQKGIDLFADEVRWILGTFPASQVIVIGPVGDGFGYYAQNRLERVAQEEEFKRRLFVKCEFVEVGSELKFAADFCMMPSRDEPFGYVDIEFAWHGALFIGAQAGGLGKVPGFYYVAQNRDNLGRLRRELRQVVTRAMERDPERLREMAAVGAETTFPLARWRRQLLRRYADLVPRGTLAASSADHPCETARRDDNTGSASLEPRQVEVGESLTTLNDEFLVQELSEKELIVRVRELLASNPDYDIKQVVEHIGYDINREREKDSPRLTHLLLHRVWGIHVIDILVSLGYVTSSVLDTLAIVQATEWSNRADFVRDEVLPDHFYPVVLFSCNAFGYAIGAPLWVGLCMCVSPRVLLGANMMLKMVLVLSILPFTPTLVFSICLALLNGLVASGGILFVVFNFMMSLKADFTEIAVRLGALEMGRYCIQWFVMSCVFIANPSAITGTREQAITWDFTLAMLPIAAMGILTIPVPAVMLFYAPGPYREDRLPGLDFSVFFKRPSFLCLCASDMLGALIAYPAATYITWWLTQGWSIPDLVWISAVVGVCCAVGLGMFATAIALNPRSGLIILVSITLLLAPPLILRALVQAQVSTDVDIGRSEWALAISIASLVLEGVRTSAVWTAKLRMLKDRWRFLSYSTMLLCVVHLIKMLSPWACEGFVWLYNHGTLFSPNQRRLAQAVEYVTIWPGMVALLQFVAQCSAVYFINRDMEVAKGAEYKWERSTWGRRANRMTRLVVLSLGALWCITIAIATWESHKHTGEQPLHPHAWPCDARGPQDCEIVADLTNGGEAVYGTATFGLNRFGVSTTGRANCLKETLDRGGNTFVFWASPGRCLVQRCGGTPGGGAGADPNVTGQVWSTNCNFRDANFVAIQLMEWRWSDIATECETFLGPAGYRAIHVSPPQEHILGPIWPTRYQPVSYDLTSRSGTPAEFIDMTKRCLDVGVHIMVDAIVNHMASTLKEGWQISSDGNDCFSAPGGCTGVAGTEYGSRRFPDNHHGVDRFMPEDFHHRFGDMNTNCGWPPWANDRYNCDMRSLPDLNTEMESVQLRMLRYLFGLYEVGVTYLRIDAAGSVYTRSLSQITFQVPWDYMVQEYYPGDILGQIDSLDLAHVTDLEYGWQMGAMGALFDDNVGGAYVDTVHKFRDLLMMGQRRQEGASSAAPYVDGLHVAPEDQGLVFIANHDTERERWQANETPVDDDGYLCSYPDGGTRGHKCCPIYKHGLQYHLAQLFMLAWPYGRTVRVYSAYAFTDFRGGPPLEDPNDTLSSMSLSVGNGPDPQIYPSKCKLTPDISPASRAYDADPERPWVCQHRWRGMAGMVKFRTYIEDYFVSDVRSIFDDREGHLAYSIGRVAFVALSRGHNTWTGHGSNATFNLTGIAVDMPNGTYCNFADVDYWQQTQNSSDCAGGGGTVEVGASGTIVSGSLPGGGLVAIHVRYALDA